jgi:hypothetical protein
MEKSRKISLEQFVINLQLEYLSCKLRSIVYNRIESVELVKIYKDIAEKKKAKILNLKQRFRLGTMFDSDKAFSDFYLKEFLQEYGLPNFIPHFPFLLQKGHSLFLSCMKPFAPNKDKFSSDITSFLSTLNILNLYSF